jgi:FAD/FMN-containing dehydrogenase
VVLPSGDAVTASADDHADLFWALRGGGAALGVVTSFTFRTFTVADRDVVTLVFPDGATAQAISGWHGWLDGADRAIWSMVNVTVGGGSGGCTIVMAAPAGEGEAGASDLGKAIGVSPVDSTTQTLGRMDFVHYFEGGAQAATPRSFVAGSDVISEMTPDAAESIVAATAEWPAGAGSATAVIESLSGAVRDVGAGDSAFPWRHHAGCIQWYTEPPPQGIDAAKNWLADAHSAVQDHSVGGYVNYLEPDTAASRYFGENTDRLGAIRRKYDPAALMYSAM